MLVGSFVQALRKLSTLQHFIKLSLSINALNYLAQYTLQLYNIWKIILLIPSLLYTCFSCFLVCISQLCLHISSKLYASLTGMFTITQYEVWKVRQFIESIILIFTLYCSIMCNGSTYFLYFRWKFLLKRPYIYSANPCLILKQPCTGILCVSPGHSIVNVDNSGIL
jgi:hypothetical protein